MQFSYAKSLARARTPMQSDSSYKQLEERDEPTLFFGRADAFCAWLDTFYESMDAFCKGTSLQKHTSVHKCLRCRKQKTMCRGHGADAPWPGNTPGHICCPEWWTRIPPRPAAP